MNVLCSYVTNKYFTYISYSILYSIRSNTLRSTNLMRARDHPSIHSSRTLTCILHPGTKAVNISRVASKHAVRRPHPHGVITFPDSMLVPFSYFICFIWADTDTGSFHLPAWDNGDSGWSVDKVMVLIKKSIRNMTLSFR